MSREQQPMRTELMEEHAMAADALSEIRRHLDEGQRLEHEARSEALVSAAILRANAIQRSADAGPVDGDRAWELIHELHAYEYDLLHVLEDTPGDAELTHALETVVSALKTVRPMTDWVLERVRAEDPEAANAQHAIWEDAREARQAFAEGTLKPEEAARLKTIFIERAQRLEDDASMLEQFSHDSGVRRHPEDQESAVRALNELRSAIAELGKNEAVKKKAEQPILTEVDFEPKDEYVRELEKIAKQQQTLAKKVMEKYGQGPQELFEAGGPSGYKEGLRRLVSSDEDQIKDPYEKWKKFEERRQVIEAVRNPPLPAEESLPIPLKRRKKKSAA